MNGRIAPLRRLSEYDVLTAVERIRVGKISAWSMWTPLEKTLLHDVSRKPAAMISHGAPAKPNTTPRTAIAAAEATIRCLRSKRSMSGTDTAEPNG